MAICIVLSISEILRIINWSAWLLSFLHVIIDKESLVSIVEGKRFLPLTDRSIEK